MITTRTVSQHHRVRLRPESDRGNSTGQLPQGQIAGVSFLFSFTEPLGVSGITYGAEWSTTMAANEWHAISDTGTAPQHKFSVPISDNPNLFVRLKVTSP